MKLELNQVCEDLARAFFFFFFFKKAWKILKEQTKKATKGKTTGLCHTVALAFTLIKKYFKAKEELWKAQLFHHAKI
jgi:hypothetical protein